jgi:hypothetical protein
MLPPETVASLKTSLAEYAGADRAALTAPEFQVISEYAPANGPTCLDLNLIHESVWRGFDPDRHLPDRVGLPEFTDLLTSTVAQWLPRQRQPQFTIVGFTLMYDAPADPVGPAGGVAGGSTRVMMALDVDGRRYVARAGAGRDATVQVVESGMPLPIDATDPLSSNLQMALSALIRLVVAADEPHHDGTDERVLNAGEIVTVVAVDDAHADTPRNQAFVVIDGFDHPSYGIAALGGDGYEWRSQPREWLQVVYPPQLRQHRDTDGNIIYVVD